MSDTFDNTNPIAGLTEADRNRLRKAWAESTAVWRFVPGRGNPKYIRKWLGQQGPAEWHDIALNFDHDGKDLTPLHFIASQPTADRASIMSMVLDQDLMALEQQVRRTSQSHIHKTRPHVAVLLDLIQTGFERGFYTNDSYGLSQPQSVLTRTDTNIRALADAHRWPLPKHAWQLVQAKPHHPDYVWDTLGSCQRLPFDIWVKTRLRPN